ncbi:hypothetical protein SAMN04490247_2631 [Salimicrobium halophilum]|uniref:Uncharacterized protein n=1 Tax=Salimicrobium halophilum TaxID=86666 RepID=A0A1G8VC74_9BACI|nr:hypothetical protein SAMN04490247_2631 [Salimicrobium halophilum]
MRSRKNANLTSISSRVSHKSRRKERLNTGALLFVQAVQVKERRYERMPSNFK